MQEYPVLVCGAGPTGLTLAVELARRGVAVDVIDKKSTISPFSKALGIQARTLEYLAMMGTCEPFLQSGLKLDTFNVDLDGNQLRASFADLRTQYPFVLILGQNETEKFLTQRLAELGVTIRLDHELSAIQSEVKGREFVVAEMKSPAGPAQERFSYIAGCDGPRSLVREAMQVEFAGKTYEEEFLLVDGQSRAAPDDWQLTLRNKQVNLLIPMATGLRAVVNVPHEDLQAESNQDAEKIVNDLYRYQDICGGRTEFDRVDWASRFRIHRRIAGNYRKGRLFLAGDSAHVHSPAGGQGMNTGIGDAMNLGWKLAAVLKHNRPAKLLDSYEAERRSVALQVLKSTDIFTRISTGDGVWGLARRVAGPLLGSISRAGIIGRRISQLDVNYSAGLSLARLGIGDGRFEPGVRFYMELHDHNSEAIDPVGLFDGRWLAVCFQNSPLPLPPEFSDEFKAIQVVQNSGGKKLQTATYGTKENIPSGKVCLVRPDGFVHSLIPATELGTALKNLWP